jgi:hypothetical protein
MPHAKSFFPDIIVGNLAPASCWMVPKELILQAGCYHSAQRYFEDWDLWWRVGLTGATFVPIDFVGFYYRQHVGSQLATAAGADRAYGHAWLMERMSRALLEREDILSAHGDTLFWAAYAALRACRAFDVSWDRLIFLCTMLETIARRRPAGLERSSFARVVRLLGFRSAELMQRLSNRRVAAPSYRAPWLTPRTSTADGVPRTAH